MGRKRVGGDNRTVLAKLSAGRPVAEALALAVLHGDVGAKLDEATSAGRVVRRVEERSVAVDVAAVDLRGDEMRWEGGGAEYLCAMGGKKVNEDDGVSVGSEMKRVFSG